MKKFFSILFIALTLFVCVACGDKTEYKIDVNEKAITLEVGDSKKITLTATEGVTLVWESADPKVVTVTDGTVQAVGKGEAVVTVYIKDHEDAKATITVTVNEKIVKVTNVSVTGKNAMVEGDEQTLTLTVTPTDATDKGVTWASSDTTIATVNNGVVKALKAGEVVISATAKDGSAKKGSLTISVTAKGPQTGDKEDLTAPILVGVFNNKALDANVFTLNNDVWECTVKILEDISTDMSVATGKVFTAEKTWAPDKMYSFTGEAVTEPATSNYYAGTYTFKYNPTTHVTEVTSVITPVDPTGIVFKFNDTEYKTGDTINITEFDKGQLSVSYLPADRPVREGFDLEFDETVLTIDSEYKYEAIKAGSVQLSVVVANGSFDFVVTVVVAEKHFAPETVTVSKTAPYCEIDSTITLTAVVTPERASKEVVWTVDNEEIATIDNNGVLTGKAAGTVKVTATSKEDSAVLGELSVEVKAPVVVDLSKVYVSASCTEQFAEFEVDSVKYVVGKNAFNTLDAAVKAVLENGTIYVNDGSYTGAVTIDKNGITIKGINADVNPVTNLAGRQAEVSSANVITVTQGVSKFVFTGFTVTGGFQILLSNETSDIEFSNNICNETSADGMIHGPAATELTSNIKMMNNYSEAFKSFRFAWFNNVDGIVMTGNKLTGAGVFDFLNAQGYVKGNVVITGNTFTTSLQSFVYSKGVGVINATIENNYVEGIANTIIDFRGMTEDGENVFNIKYNTFVNSGTGWCPIRIRTASYDDNDSIIINVENNKFIDSYYEENGVKYFIENPAYVDGTAKFDKIYTVGKNFYSAGGTPITELVEDNFSGAAISIANPYATEAECPTLADVKVIVLKTTESEIEVDDTLALDFTITPEGTITWVSSDTAIATVDAAGVVTAVATGEVTIKGYAFGSNEVEVKLTVIAKTVALTIAGVVALADDTTAVVEGVVQFANEDGFIIRDDTLGLYVTGQANVKAGDKVKVAGVKGTNKGIAILSSTTSVKVLSSGNTTVTPVEKTAADYKALTNDQANVGLPIIIGGTFVKSSTFINFALDAKNTVYLTISDSEKAVLENLINIDCQPVLYLYFKNGTYPHQAFIDIKAMKSGFVYVDANAEEDSMHAKTFAGALTKLYGNGEIRFAAGTYTEAIDVELPITISGPNADINPVTGERIEEAVFTAKITVKATGVTIKGIKLSDAGQILVADSDLKIINCTNDSEVSSIPAGNGFVYLSGVVSNLEISNCKFVAKGSRCIYLGGQTLTGLKVSGCYLEQTTTDACDLVRYEYAAGEVVFENNTFSKCGQFAIFLGSKANTANILVTNNMFDQGGATYCLSIRSVSTGNVTFTFNTFQNIIASSKKVVDIRTTSGYTAVIKVNYNKFMGAEDIYVGTLGPNATPTKLNCDCNYNYFAASLTETNIYTTQEITTVYDTVAALEQAIIDAKYENKLPIDTSFVGTASGVKDVPEGWTTTGIGGTYGTTFYQSFRNDGQNVLSPIFAPKAKVKVTFSYYANNASSSDTGSSKILIEGLDEEGNVVATWTSDNIAPKGVATGVANATTLETTLEATAIYQIKVSMIKASGGNIAFSNIKLEVPAA